MQLSAWPLVVLAIVTTPFGVAALVVATSFLSAKLTVTADGLTYRRWPLPAIEAGWSDCERISKGQVAGSSEATMLVRRETPGREFTMGRSVLGLRNHKMIPLSDFRGWVEGRIPQEIARYAPQLLGDQPGQRAG